jgi:hypothetical protein
MWSVFYSIKLFAFFLLRYTSGSVTYIGVELAKQPSQASNSQSSRHALAHAGITVVYHHTQSFFT